MYIKVGSKKYPYVTVFILYTGTLPFQVAARSKAWVCGRLRAGIMGSNPSAGTDFCLLWVLCVVRYRSLHRAECWNRGVPLSVVLKSRKWGGTGPLGSVVSCKRKILVHYLVLSRYGCIGCLQCDFWRCLLIIVRPFSFASQAVLLITESNAYLQISLLLLVEAVTFWGEYWFLTSSLINGTPRYY